MASRKEQKERARNERLAAAAAAAAEAAARRRRQLQIGGAAAGMLAVAIIAVVLVVTGGASGGLSGSSTPRLKLESSATLGHLQPAPAPGAAGPEGVPIPDVAPLAGTGQMAGGQTVDGVKCLGQEQVLFHIHAHLTIFVDGKQRQLPYGIGITGAQVQNTQAGAFVGGGSCFYFLHTHAADGIVHIESPVQRTYTLGNFFDIWGQKLKAKELGPNAGRVVA